ncbi:hypothetical protein ACHAWF_005500 [Thalassiosira exigua]
MSIRLLMGLLCCVSVCFRCDILPAAAAIEATFTPNPQDSVENGGDGGPLPVSMQQRKQLLELEAAIVNSQDPAATLNHVAQQNGLSQEDLIGMLERNRKDLQETGQLEGMVNDVNASIQSQGGGGGRRTMAGATLPRRILSFVASVVMALLRTASGQISRNPRQSVMLGMLVTCALLVVHNAPKNGIVLSSGSFPPFSRGRTTLLAPPVEYLQHSWVVSQSKYPMEVKSKSSKSKKGAGMTRTLEMDSSDSEEGKVIVETKVKSDGFAQVTYAQTVVLLDADRNDTEDNDENISELQEEALRESISGIFGERKFGEFAQGGLLFHSFLVESEGGGEDSYEEGTVMAMKLLGDFGRYGLQPLCIAYEDEEETDGEPLFHCVAFHTLGGGHFEGEMKFSVEEREGAEGLAPGVVISVILAIPEGGRTPGARLAESMVSSLVQSMAQSTQLRMKQTLSRRSQGRRFRAQASGRASLKRHLRYEQEKAQEEMAADRKRKWKRNNPDAGHYRPSGHRLRTPGGSPNFH